VNYLIEWSPRSGISFPAFLQQTSRFQGRVVYEVRESLRILGSIQQTQKRGWQEQADNQRAGITLLSRRLGNIDRNLADISREVTGVREDIHASTNELLSALRWGFGSLATAIGEVNDTLDEIRKNGVKPSGVWAQEQYHWACYAYDHGWYPEALEYASNAIDGIPGETGYKLDPHYHYLLGRIRIGGWIGERPNVDLNLVRPDLAEQAFLKAARYSDESRYVWAGEKGEALLYAARAAYLQGALNRACAHAHAGLHILNWLWGNLPGEIDRGIHRSWKNAKQFAAKLNALRIVGTYQYSKYLCAAGIELAEAERNLLEAFRSNLGCIIEAKVDPDFSFQRVVFENALSRIAIELREEYSELRSKYETAYLRACGFSFNGVPAVTLLREELAGTYDAIEREAKNGGPLDHHSAIQMMKSALQSTPGYFAVFQARFAQKMTKDWTESSISNAAEAADVEMKHAASILQQAKSTRAAASQRLVQLRESIWFGLSILIAVVTFVIAVAEFVSSAPVWTGGSLAAAGLSCLSAFIVLRLVIREIPIILAGRRAALLAERGFADAEQASKALNLAKMRAWESLKEAIRKLSEMNNPFA